MGRVRHRTLGAAATGACMALLAAACSQPAETGRDESGDPSGISIATGTTAGIYYPVGGAMAEIINREVEGVTASAESTGGSVENLRLIESGQSDVAIAQGDVVYQAYHGEDTFEGEPVRTQPLMVLYPNVYHAVSLESVHEKEELNCFGDIKGKRFSVGAPGSGNEVATNLVFDALEMDPSADITVERYAYAETARALRQGEIDAGSWVVGEGHSSLLELETTDPLHLVPMCEDEQDRVTTAHPFYTPHLIESGVYTSVKEPVPTLALWNVLAAPEDMSEERGYELAKALYENTDFLGQVYESGADYMVLESLANSPVPLHPGVVRYAAEQGVDIPAGLQP